MRDLYIFPINSKAIKSSKEDQAAKIIEEAREIVEAFDGRPGLKKDAHIIEECFDCIQAIEGLLRKYPLHLVIANKVKVLVKCHMRGDY